AGRVKAGKKMTRAQLLKLAGGRLYTGRQAKEVGIIDELGTLEDAIADAAKLGGLPAGKETETVGVAQAQGVFDQMLGSALDARMNALVPALAKMPELKKKLRGLDALLLSRKAGVWAMIPYGVEIR